MTKRVCILLLAAAVLVGCGQQSDPSHQSSSDSVKAAEQLIVYSGRSKTLVGELLDRFEAKQGIRVETRYGNTTELAATILEEGDRSPAVLFFAQDAGALGALDAAGRLAPIPERLLDLVDPAFRSNRGHWIGISGRARSVVYNTDNVTPEQLPDSVEGFLEPQWRGRIGWAPLNGSFQSFVTAFRKMRGDQAASAWVKGILANDPVEYAKNSAIVRAVGAGEVDVGFVNHYYLYRFLAEQGESFPARNHFLAAGDPGALINVAGVGVLSSADASAQAAAHQLIEFLLGTEAQSYFAQQTFEYPLRETIERPIDLPALSEIRSPNVDLTELQDLQGTLDLLREVGALD